MKRAYHCISDEVEIITHHDSDIAPVAYLRIKKASLQEKEARDWAPNIPNLLADQFSEAAKIISEMELNTRVSCHREAVTSELAMNLPVSHRILDDWIALGNVRASPSDGPPYISVADEVKACFLKITGMPLKLGS